MKGYVVSKCKEDEYDDIGVAHSDLLKKFRVSLGHAFIWKKARPLGGLSVRVLEL